MRVFSDDHPPAATLTGRNGEWRDRWYVHDEVDVIAPPNRNAFRMIYLTHRWARALVEESSRPRGAVNSRRGGKCPGCHFQGTRWIFLRARPSNRNWARLRKSQIPTCTNVASRRVRRRRRQRRRRRRRWRRQRQGCER